MITSDPFEMLLAAAPAVPAEETEMRRAARSAMFTGSRRQRRRVDRRAFLVATAAGCGLLIAGVGVHTASSPESASAAAGELSQIAARQPALDLEGQGPWVTASYTVRYQWTQTLTQEGIDRIVANKRKVQRSNSGQYMCVSDLPSETMTSETAKKLRLGKGGPSKGFKPCSSEKLRRIEELNRQEFERIQSVPVDSLPTRTVTAVRTSPMHMYMNKAGEGGGGGVKGGNEIEYGSPDQAKTAKILEDHRIGGRYVDPADMGGFELGVALTDSRGRGEKSVEGLSATPEGLRKYFAAEEPTSFAAGKLKAGSSEDLFIKSARLTGSPFATPQQRAAALNLIGGLPGVALVPEAKDLKGREGIGFALDITGGNVEVIFDGDNSRLLGLSAEVTDPAEFSKNHWAGSGETRVKVEPKYDHAKIAVSYESFGVTDVEPRCAGGPCPPGTP